MDRKEFPQSVVESVLIKCRRHCCVCDTFCGVKIVLHHMDSADDYSEDNALPVCFNCHAEIMHYNENHPMGRRYKKSELKKLRDKTYAKYSIKPTNIPEGHTDYGHGFHDGVAWSEKISNLKQFWQFLSTHGDFALEILIYFMDDDSPSMHQDLLLDKAVETGTSYSQLDLHVNAWQGGRIIGLWDVNVNTERLFLTNKGRQFKEYINSNLKLNERLNILKEFWVNHEYSIPEPRPQTFATSELENFKPGILNWLVGEIYRLIRLEDQSSNIFIIDKVTPTDLYLKDINTGEEIHFKENEIDDVMIDEKTGELTLRRSM